MMTNDDDIIEFKEYVGLAGDCYCLLTMIVNGEKRGSTLYNRAYFPIFNKNRAKKRLRKLYYE